MAEYNVEADRENNRLYVDMDGQMKGEIAEACHEEVLDAMAELEDGLEVITDLRDFVPGDDSASKLLEEAKAQMRKHNASAAVRVMPDSVTAQMHFERVGQDEEGYPVAVANSVDQAEQLLEKRREDQQA